MRLQGRPEELSADSSAEVKRQSSKPVVQTCPLCLCVGQYSCNLSPGLRSYMFEINI